MNRLRCCRNNCCCRCGCHGLPTRQSSNSCRLWRCTGNSGWHSCRIRRQGRREAPRLRGGSSYSSSTPSRRRGTPPVDGCCCSCCCSCCRGCCHTTTRRYRNNKMPRQFLSSNSRCSGAVLRPRTATGRTEPERRHHHRRDRGRSEGCSRHL